MTRLPDRISREVRHSLLATAFVSAITVVLLTIYQSERTSREIQQAALDFGLAAAEMAELNQDPLALQREINRFVEILNRTQAHSLEMIVRIEGTVLAHVGKAEFLTSEFTSNRQLSSGRSFEARVVVSNLQAFQSALLLIVLIELGLGLVFFGVGRRLDASIRHLTNPLAHTVQWIKGAATRLPLQQYPEISELPAAEFTEVTELNDSVQILLKSIRELEVKVADTEFVRAQAHLAQQVAHDIRSPLSALNMVSASIQDEEKSQLIRAVVTRINDIATDLLKGRAASAKSEERIFIKNLVTQIVEEKRAEGVSKKGAPAWIIDCDPNLQISAVDAPKLLRALANLATNAMESFDENLLTEPKIIIAAKALPGDKWRLEVSDNGCGIPEDLIQKVATRGATFGKIHGNGLGLASVKEFAQSLGGQLEVASKLGAGTTVSLWLPNTSGRKS